MTDREKEIERRLEDHEAELWEMDDEDLLGSSYLEGLRQEEIEHRLEQYEKELSEMDDEELLGDEHDDEEERE